VWVRLDSGGTVNENESDVERPRGNDDGRLLDGLIAVAETWERNRLSDREASILTYFEYSKLDYEET
jgi:hypothetical protein